MHRISEPSIHRSPLDHELSALTIPLLMKHWGQFLSGFHWQFFATATFARPVCLAASSSAAAEWIESFGSDAYAFVAHERGTAGDRVHCHALLGGIFSHRSEIDRLTAHTRLRERWTHGDLQVQKYDPRRGAAFYLSKCPDDADIIGHLSKHRSRRKRSGTLSAGHSSRAPEGRDHTLRT